MNLARSAPPLTNALVIRDLYTKYNHVIILNAMSEFLPALKRFIARAENHHYIKLTRLSKNCMEHPPMRIGIIRMDRHTSHTSAEVTDYLKDRGTQPEYVGPGT
jgi:hypothetical protein